MKSTCTKRHAVSVFLSCRKNKRATTISFLRHLSPVFLPLLFLGATLSLQAQIAGWDFSTLPGGTNNFGPSPYGATTANVNVTVGGLTRGSGVTVSGSGAADAWGGNGFDLAATLTAAVAANNFATFTITTHSGYALSLSGIGAYNIRLSGSGPTTGQWQYQINAGAFVNIGSAITWGTNTTGAGNTQSAINLTGITDLQNVPAGTTVTFRVVSWGATSSSGNWYFNDPSNTLTEDLVVNGSIFTCSAPPSADPPFMAQTCAGSGVEIEGNPVGGVSPYSHLWTNLGTGSAFGVSLMNEMTGAVTASAMGGGTIDLRYRVTDNNGCTGSKDVTVTVNALPTGTLTETDMSGNANNDNIICEGGDATFTASPGFVNYDFRLNGGIPEQSGMSNVFSTPPPDLSDGDDVDVIVTDGNGCSATFITPTMTVYDLPTPGISSQTNVACHGNATGSVTVSGGTMYSLDGGLFQMSGTFGSLSAGSYTVTVKNANGCTADQPVTITQPNALGTSIVTQTNVACYGQSTGSVTVTGTDGTSPYMYSLDGGSYGISGTFSGLSQGVYEVTVKDAHNCTATQEVTITQSSQIMATAVPTHLTCYGVFSGAIDVTGTTGGLGGYVYSIDGGSNYFSSTHFGTLSANTYTVRILDMAGCLAILPPTVITQPNQLNATLNSTGVTCNGANDGTITLSAPVGGHGSFEYSIDGGDNWFSSGSFTGLAPGSYDVRIRDEDYPSCSRTLDNDLDITQPAVLNASVGSTNVSCFGASDGAITITSPTGGYGTYQYSIDGGMSWQSGGSFTGLVFGLYDVRIRDAAHTNCAITLNGSFSVSQPAILEANVNSTDVNCFGGSDGSITISNPTGGYGTYQYSIDGGMSWQSGGSFTNLEPNVYDVRIRDAAHIACTITLDGSLNISQSAGLSANVGSSNVTCYLGNNGSITLTSPSGGSGMYEYNIGSGWQASGSFTNLFAGTYNVQIRDLNYPSCVVTLAASLVIQQPVVLNANLASTHITCFGANDGTITLSLPTGGNGTYEYSIDGGANWQSSGSFTNLIPATYDVRIRDAAVPTCFIILNAALSITQPSVLSATVTPTNVTCFGAGDGIIAITLPTGGYGTYEYTINGGTNWYLSGSFTGLAPGTYDVRIRDAAHTGCYIILNNALQITEPAILDAYVSNSGVGCFGASNGMINFTLPTGGYGSYEYSIDGMNWQGSGSFTGLAAGNYSAQIRDALHPACVIILFNLVTITQPGQLNASLASTNITCFGALDGSITLSSPVGGFGNYEYSIDGGTNWQSDGSFTGLAPGTYNVQIRDANVPSCVVILNNALVLTEPAILSASVASTHATCFGTPDGSITITAPMGGYGTYGYSINGGMNWQLGGSFTSLAPGFYNVQIRDAAHPACLITLNGSLQITQPAVLSANVASTNVTCNGANDGTITVSAPTGGYGTYEYSVNGGTNWQLSGSFTGLAPATYDVQIRDAAHPACVIVLNNSLQITQPAVLSATVASTNVTCNGAGNGTITVSAPAGGYGTYEYSIDGGTNWQSGGSFTGLAPATYDVRIRDAAHINCEVTLDATLLITQPAVLSANVASTNVTCFGANDGTITLTLPSGGYGTYEYSINGGTNWQSGGSFTGLAPATYDVRIRDAAHIACVITLNGSLQITEPAVLSANVASTNITCFQAANGTITISSPMGGYGTYEYSIDGGVNWQLGGSFTNLAPGTYNVQIRDAAHIACVITLNGTVSITQPALLSATINTTHVTCYGANDGIISLTGATGGYGTYEYSIDGGTTWQSGSSFTGLSPDLYNVQIRDAAHPACEIGLNSMVLITQPAVLNASVASSNVTCFGGSDGSITITLPTGGYGTYEYSIDGGTTWQSGGSFIGLVSGTYNVRIRDAAHIACVITLNGTLVITQPAVLNASVVASNVTCFGGSDGSITLTLSTGGHGTYEYSIDGGTTWQSSGSFTGLIPGTYDVRIRDAAYNTCSIVLNGALAVNEPAVLNATVMSTNLTCYQSNNGTITISAPTGGHGTYEYSIDGGSSWQGSGSYMNLLPGSYNVRIRDAAYQTCVITLNPSLVITEPAQVFVAPIMGSNIVYVGTSTQLSNATPLMGGSAEWESTLPSKASVDQTGFVFGLMMGTTIISYTVTDVNNCTNSATFTMNVSVPVINIGVYTHVAASPAGNKLKIKINPTVEVINGQYSSGTFTLRTATANGVTGLTVLSGVGYPNPYNYHLVGSNLNDGGYDYYVFNFNDPNLISWSANSFIDALTIGYNCAWNANFEIVQTYTSPPLYGNYYQELNGGGAQNQISPASVTSPLAINIVTAKQDQWCSSLGWITLAVTQGSPFYSFDWSDDGEDVPDNDSQNLYDLVAGTYTVTVTDENGCTASTATAISYLPVTNTSDMPQTHYATIQAAVNAADPNENIEICAGTYPEAVSVNKTGLTLNGAGVDLTIVNHTGTAPASNAGIHAIANGVTIKNLTVTGNPLASVPRYGLKVGTDGVTTDNVVVQNVKVHNSFRTGFDIARAKNLTMTGITSINNGGAGIFMSNTEGALLTNITTTNNPWTGVSVATRNDWAGDSYGVVFAGANSFGESTGKNGGLQLEMTPAKLISWSNDINDSKDVTILPADFGFALSGPTVNAPYAPYVRFYQTLLQAQTAAAGVGPNKPDHIEANNRYIRDVDNSMGEPGTNFYVYDNANNTMTIQAAINAAVVGNTINVYAGTFEENVNVTQSVTITGAGNGSNPATNTVLSPASACSGVGITIAAANVTLQNMYLTGYQDAVLVNGVNNPTMTNLGLVDYCRYGVNLGGSSQNINITQTTMQRTSPLAGTIGIRAGTANAVNGMMIDGCSITGNTQGITVFQATTPVAFNNITIQNSTISNNSQKGMYFEKLSNALFSNLTMDMNGTDVSYANNNGIDVNLKYNSYSNITIQNCNITNSGATGTATDPQAPAAIAIKARDDSPSYNAIPASLSNVLIKNNRITGPRNGIRIGEYGKINATPSGVVIEGNDLSYAFGHKAIISRINQDIDVNCNWHGTMSLPTILASFVAAGSGEIDLNFILNSGGSNLPGFVPTGTCVCPSGNVVTNVNTAQMFCSITDAIDDAGTSNGHVLNVGAGTYVENIVVNKQLIINGPNAGINPCSGSPVAPAIVLPATSGISTVEIFHVAASNVTIAGFTIDGDNPALTSGFTSTTLADIDAAEGVTVYETGINNLTVTNNIFKNLSYFAVTLYDYPAGVPSSGHVISNNKIQDMGTYHVGSGVERWGGGVLLYNNQYAQVSNNCMNNVRLGVQTGNFHLANPGAAATINNNTMTNVRRSGVFHNLHYGTASAFTVSGNSISGTSNANETKWDGVSLSSLTVPSTTSGNIVVATAVTQPSSGIEVWNVGSATPATISGGSVTDASTCIFVNNYDGYVSDATDGAHASISGITLNPTAAGTGIRVYDNPASTHANVQASVGAGVVINNGTNGLVVENTSASVPSMGSAAFAGQSVHYIKLVDNANNINATAATFEGNTGAAATLAQNFAIEDKVLHKIDNSVLGFVLVKADHDFVTTNSFSAPATTFALVQRGIDAASPGFTVNVNSGTYANAVDINKELKLYGLNSGISPVTGVRLPEATLATASGIMVNVTTTDPVEIKGLRLANAGGAYDYSVTGTVGTTITMEKNFFDNSIGVYIPNAVSTTLVDNLCTFSAGADEGFALFGNYNGSTGTHIDVHDNKWLNGQMTGMNLSSCEGVIYNNIFDNIAYYGILAANQSNLNIYQNEFTGIDNPDPMVTTWGAGIRFYDDAPGAIVNVHNNTFTGNYIGISVRPAYDFSGNTANVYDNSITGSTIANIRHEGAGTLPAECNWFGFTASAAVAATISGTVDYNPWRVSSTDTDPGTLGFQPTGACSGTPVEIAVNVVSPETCTGGTSNGSITTITSNGLAPYMYLWSNATTNANATGLIGGTYTVVVTDANGSTAVTSATVLALLVSNFTSSTDYATVQAAINAAMPGDVIQMCTKTFNERVVIDKSLTLEGKTTTKANYILNGTGLGTGDGIHINDNVTGVTIRNLTVQNFTGASGNANAAIYANAGNNMLTVSNVALLNNPTASGFYANGPISNVSITNSTVTNNGGAARGIVIWNGFKQNITITGNTLTNNTCCGIELQDGTASNVVVSNNTIDVGTGDNAIGLLGLNNSVGNNLIQSNIISGGGRFGIEIKNPNGGVTVSGNTLTLTTQDGSLRDRAGIAVFRRDFTLGNPQGYADIPNGVTISGNMVSGYTQPSTEEGFGIVVEGVSHSITGNTITGSDVGIQIQGGGHANANYVPNDVGSGDQDPGNSPNYFGRGNTPYVCDISESGNMFSGNGTDRRMVTSLGVFVDPGGMATINNQLAREVTLDNGVTQRVYCTIQAAVNAATGSGVEFVKVASAATQTSYNEQVLVNKDVTLQGVGPTKPLVDFTGNPTAKATLFDVSANGVTIDGIQFNTNLTKLSSAIIASAPALDEITVKNNMINPYQSTPGTYLSYSGSYGDRNAISINYGGSTGHNYRTATGGVNSILVDNNMVSATVNGAILGDDSGDIGFRAASAVDEGAGNYTRNTFQTINHDVIVRFNSNGPLTIGGSALLANTFNGGGVTIAENNAGGGAVDISFNTFNGLVSGSVVRLQNNQQNKATSVHDNTFTNLRWGISLENYPAVTIEDNTFSPLAGYTTFRHITVNTKSLSSNSSTIVQVPINGIIRGNTFNSLTPTTGGTALAFYNHDSDNASLVANAFTVGATGEENLFQKDFTHAIYLGNQTGMTLDAPVLSVFPEYNLGAGSNTSMVCWNLDIDIEKNKFDVGAGLQFPKDMTGLQLTALENKLYHQNDNACLGELIYFKPVMVNAKVYLQGPYDATTMLPHLMVDQLRRIVALPKFPLADPYPAFTPDITPYWDAFVHVNHTTNEVIDEDVLDDFSANSIVDWVFLELRNPLNYLEVLATRSALVQRDGDIVDLDGTSEVLFPNSYKGNYYLMVRHRNHLGALTANVIDFNNDATFVDFSSPSMPTFGTTSVSARKLLEPGRYGLIAGNTNMKVGTSAPFQVIYNNDGNDRTPILIKVGFATPLNVVPGYFLEDVNLDGVVKYNGDQNDRVMILNNVGLATPLNIITQQPPN